jgi:hypothetical protein
MSENQEQEKLVTLATFDHPLSAHVLKTKLENEGIEAFLTNENFLGVNPLASEAVGGVKVQVRESDEAIAKIVMKN